MRSFHAHPAAGKGLARGRLNRAAAMSDSQLTSLTRLADRLATLKERL